MMNSLLTRRLALLAGPDGAQLLRDGLRGLEREALRVDGAGRLAASMHPQALGAALTHPAITTDYAEALIELITPAEHDVDTMLAGFDALHRFVAGALDDAGETLWGHSMPCALPDEAAIPIAWYGTSHSGMLKHVYRRGLALRYGKAMQCIAGVHYNYSLAPVLWKHLHAAEREPDAMFVAATADSAMHVQSAGYVALIRNFRRYGWLLMILFGAAPALARDFRVRADFPLERLGADTLYLPYATSLRMSDMGYQNDAQTGLTPDYNTLDAYIGSMAAAMNQPHLPYVELGTRRDGQWVQINTNRLQIENEYYSAIRPKRVVQAGERPLHALAQRGVQYVEVRCLDIDPFEPLGIGADACHFLDVFLLFCALEHSPPTGAREGRDNTANFSRCVKEGRRPGLTLERDGGQVALRDWGLELIERMAPVAARLDAAHGTGAHAAALASGRAKLVDMALTPSARVLDAIRAEGGFEAFALARSRAHAATWRARPLDAVAEAALRAEAAASLLEQARIEGADRGSFDAFLARYQATLRELPAVRAHAAQRESEAACAHVPDAIPAWVA